MGCFGSKTDGTSPPHQVNVEEKRDESKSDSPIDHNHDEMSENQILVTIKEIPILASLSEVEQRKLAKNLEERKFESGENLMVQGEQGSEFFIIASGKCKVLVKEEDDKEVEIALLEDGDYCGEQALLQSATRGATVRAISSTRCFVLKQKAFKDIMQENQIRFANRDAKRNAISAELLENIKNNEDEEKVESATKSDSLKQWLLASVSENILFSHLDDPQKEIVIEHMYHKTASSGEFLIRQGEEGNTFYVVESGEFVITVKDVGQVDTLTRGRCVGELALLYNAPRAASVQAISDGEVWAVDRGAFRKALMDVQIKSSDRNIEFLKKM